MYQGFWRDLRRPIIGLSPMDGVTDQPFRHLHKKISQPDIVITEFTSAEGIAHNATKLFDDFLFDETQRPVIAQIFGKEPRALYITAVILGYLGFDGIDINMGCPAKSVEQHGAGAALIRTPDIAQAIFRATRQGIQDWANGLTLDDLPELKQKTKLQVLARHSQLPEIYQRRRELPVSVKTRVGFDQIVIQDWIKTLLEVEPAAITVHGRTLRQLYSGVSNWEAIALAKETARDTESLVLGNGDIKTVADFYEKVKMSGVDGALIGRATFGDPWILGEIKKYRDEHWNTDQAGSVAQNWVRSNPSWQDRVQVIIEHTELFQKAFPEHPFLAMRKHLGWYISGFPGASELRSALVRANSAEEVRDILARFPEPVAA